MTQYVSYVSMTTSLRGEEVEETGGMHVVLFGTQWILRRMLQ